MGLSFLISIQRKGNTMKHGEMGKRLAKLRKHLHVSQKQLADKMCVSRSSISKYENGFASLDVDLADAILKEFGAICILGVDLTEDEALFIRQALSTYRSKQARRPIKDNEKNTT